MKFQFSLLQISLVSFTLFLSACVLSKKSGSDSGSSAVRTNPAPSIGQGQSCVNPSTKVTVLDGAKEFGQFFSTNKVYEGDACEHYAITLWRTCNNGSFESWQGTTSNFYEKCQLDASKKSCTPGEEESKTFYRATTVPWGQSCAEIAQTLTRECTTDQNGKHIFASWTKNPAYATYQFNSCTELEPLACENVNHGESFTKTYYTQKNSTAGNPCVAKTTTATCNNGKLNHSPALPATYYDFCDEGKEYRSCSNGKYAHNAIVETRTRYKLPVADLNQKCQKETQKRICQDGTIGQFDGSYVFPECKTVSNDWRVVDTTAIAGKLSDRMTYDGQNLFACGGRVFFVTKTQYFTKYIEPTTYNPNPTAETEELYYFTPSTNLSTAEIITQFTYDRLGHNSYLPHSIFKTDQEFQRKSFSNFTCIDNQYLLFTISYQDQMRLTGGEYLASYAEKVAVFHPDQNLFYVTDANLLDYGSSKGKTASFTSSLPASSIGQTFPDYPPYTFAPKFSWLKYYTYKNQNLEAYDIVFNYDQGPGSITLSVKSDFGIYFNEYTIRYAEDDFQDNHLAAILDRHQVSEPKFICSRRAYANPSAGVLPSQKDGNRHVQFYGLQACGSSIDDPALNYYFEITTPTYRYTWSIPSLPFRVPAKYIGKSTSYVGFGDSYAPYQLAGLKGRLINFDGQNLYLYLAPANFQDSTTKHWAILKIDYDRYLEIFHSYNPYPTQLTEAELMEVFPEMDYVSSEETNFNKLPKLAKNIYEMLGDIHGSNIFIPATKGMIIRGRYTGNYQQTCTGSGYAQSCSSTLAGIESEVGTTNSVTKDFTYFKPVLEDGTYPWTTPYANWDEMSYDPSTNRFVTTSFGNRLALVSLSSKKGYRLKPDTTNKVDPLITVIGKPVISGNYAYFIGRIDIKPDNTNDFRDMVQLFKVPIPTSSYQ